MIRGPRRHTTVLAVPRSIPKRLENNVSTRISAWLPCLPPAAREAAPTTIIPHRRRPTLLSLLGTAETSRTWLAPDERGLRVVAEDATIVRLVIRLAHELRLAAIAEGVEGHEQRDQLEWLGCDHGRGYVWSASQGSSPSCSPDLGFFSGHRPTRPSMRGNKVSHPTMTVHPRRGADAGAQISD
jgi:hypothetical protein